MNTLCGVEEQLRLFTEAVQDHAFFLLDADGRVASWDRGGERLLGYRADEIVGQPAARLFAPEDVRDGLPDRERAAAAAAGRTEGERWHLRADGRRLWCRAVTTSLRGADGKPCAFGMVLRDLSERRRWEEEVGERERVAAFDTEVGLALTGGAGLRETLQRCSEAMIRHLGGALARVWTVADDPGLLELQASAGLDTHPNGGPARIPVGRGRVGLVARDRRPYLTNAVAGDPHVAEPDWARREGLVGFAGCPLVVGDRLVGVMALFARQALSNAVVKVMASVASGLALAVERRRAEDRLRDETRITETLNRIGGILAAELDLPRLVQLVTDEATRLTGAQFGAFFFNAVNEQGEAYTLCSLSGAPREAFAGFPTPRNTALFGPTFRGEGAVRLDDVTKDPRYGHNPPYHGMPPGHLPVRSYLAVPVVARSGEVLGGLFFGHTVPGAFAERDERLVTAVAAQAAIAIDNARLYQEARTAGEQLRQRNEELGAAARRKDEFLSMLAHELRNPLAPIRTGLHVMKLAAGDRQAIEKARGMMERQIGNLTQIVDDLLEVSRLTRGKIGLRLERLDLGRLARLAADDLQPAFDSAGLGVALEVPDVPVWVKGDATRLTQVLDNLLENALKFTPRGGRVTVGVRTEAEPRRAVLSVRDTGAGIDPDLLPRLFDVFSQADRSLDRSKGGLGLGLTLVKGLVELHGGEVAAASAGPGRGAEFVVRLPLQEEPAALSQMPAAPRRASRRLRILVVEDNRDAAESLRMLLHLFGHDVVVAHSGPAGVETAREWHPDVVLCDIGLPGMDGYGVVGELRRNPDTARARVIAVTGYGADEDRRRSRAAGFDQHLTKPVDPDTLQEVVAGPDKAPPAN
jgi:PAS domain S-box-containing protein